MIGTDKSEGADCDFMASPVATIVVVVVVSGAEGSVDGKVLVLELGLGLG